MIEHLKRWKRAFDRSVAGKIGGVVGIMLVVAVLTVAGTYVMVQQQHDSARVINVAGRQRMLSQHIVKHAYEVSMGSESSRRPLAESAALFAASLKALRDGDPALHLPPAPARVRPQLAKVAALWKDFYAQVRIVERSRPEDESFQQALEFIRANNEKLLEESDVVVRLFEEVANRKMATLLRFLYLLLLLDVLAFVSVFLLLRQLVLVPLYEIRRGLSILAQGNLGHRLQLRTGDELQEVAEEVNAMADRLQDSYATLERRVDERTRELTQANRELRRLDRVRAALLANVSHELKTPLIPISSLSQLMLSGRAGPLTDEQRDYLRAMLRSTERLHRFSDQLLGTIRRDQGREAFHPTPVDLCQVLRESADTVTQTIEAKNLYVDLRLPDEPLWVQGDSSMLRQVFDNLLSNAAKFTPGGGRVTLAAWSAEPRSGGAEVQGSGSCETVPTRRRSSAETRQRADVPTFERSDVPTSQRASPKSKIKNPKSVVVEVRDTGIGIPEEEQARIFERFYQATGSGYVGGTGLGLAIVKELVELHGGSVSVRSAFGEGSTFVVVLPRAADGGRK
jgi:signal transduction histidine kinase